jgi:hypothetical protein
MMTNVTVAKCCWVVTVNRETGEATTDLWDDDDGVAAVTGHRTG